MTIHTTNSTCDTKVTAQTMNPPTIKFLVDEWIVLLGSSEMLARIIPNTVAEATLERIPKTPANPAKRYVCCRPCPKSWICAPFRYRICLINSSIDIATATDPTPDAMIAVTLVLAGDEVRESVTAKIMSKVTLAIPLAAATVPSMRGKALEAPITSCCRSKITS
jgi:hypothetical protein